MKVMCFGTFDNLHPGHLDFFKQAKKLGNELVVVVARDVNVKKIKGRLPRQNENVRLRGVKEKPVVDLAIPGRKKDRMAIIKDNMPDIIALGYDQEVDIDKLRKVFLGKIIRLKPCQPDKYKSSIRNYKITNSRI